MATAELVLRMGGRTDGYPNNTALVVAKDEGVALVLVRDLIEGSD
jgi:hypothetical protein